MPPVSPSSSTRHQGAPFLLSISMLTLNSSFVVELWWTSSNLLLWYRPSESDDSSKYFSLLSEEPSASSLRYNKLHQLKHGNMGRHALPFFTIGLLAIPALDLSIPIESPASRHWSPLHVTTAQHRSLICVSPSSALNPPARSRLFARIPISHRAPCAHVVDLTSVPRPIDRPQLLIRHCPRADPAVARASELTGTATCQHLIHQPLLVKVLLPGLVYLPYR